ncbi:MAG: hypothetical protein U0518_00260 [Candidatus Gracilibacteria bacterium]
MKNTTIFTFVLIVSTIMLVSCGTKVNQTDKAGSPITAIPGGTVEPRSIPSKQAEEVTTVDVTTVSAQ